MNLDCTDYKYLLDYFGEEKVEGRYIFVYRLLQTFIEREQIQEKVYIDDNILSHAIMDYFADIYRLKEFHNIQKTNEDKITAYMLHWMIKRRPIQVKLSFDDSPFVNEKFVLSYLQSYLFYDEVTTIVPHKFKMIHEAFFKNFYYSTRYRSLDQQMIELVITAYRAGRAFQYSVDISNKNMSEIPMDAQDELL